MRKNTSRVESTENCTKNMSNIFVALYSESFSTWKMSHQVKGPPSTERHCAPRNSFHMWKLRRFRELANQIATLNNASFSEQKQTVAKHTGWRWAFKCLGIPHLIYSASMSLIPKGYISIITNRIFNFIWSKRQDKIKRDVMFQDYTVGGLRVPNAKVLFKSLNLAWISRFLTRDQYFKSPGNNPRPFLSSSLQLRNKFLENSGMLTFYKNMLENFLELRNLYREKREPISILFNNKDIVIDGNPFFFYPKWVENGSFTVQDILDDYGKYLSFNAFEGKYSV